MKRSHPPQRKKYLLRSTTPIARGRPPRARKPDPSKRRWAKHRCQPYLDWLKEQPCHITGKRTGECLVVSVRPLVWGAVTVDPAHIKHRSTGGDDRNNLVPLCRRHHDEQEGRNAEFERRYRIDLLSIAREHTERFLAEFPECRGAPPE